MPFVVDGAMKAKTGLGGEQIGQKMCLDSEHKKECNGFVRNYGRLSCPESRHSP